MYAFELTRAKSVADAAAALAKSGGKALVGIDGFCLPQRGNASQHHATGNQHDGRKYEHQNSFRQKMRTCRSKEGTHHSGQRKKQALFDCEIASPHVQICPEQTRGADDHERHADSGSRRNSGEVNEQRSGNDRTAASERPKRQSNNDRQSYCGNLAPNHRISSSTVEHPQRESSSLPDRNIPTGG